MSGEILNGSISENLENNSTSSCRALKLQTETPHLVSMGGDRLSTSVTLHPIPQGKIVLGSSPGVDISVQGTGVLPIHCHIENNEGVVTIHPLADNVSIDGVRITEPTRLSQGVMLTIGRSNYLRFNHPAEAKLMKSILPNNPRISMPPITFQQQQQQEQNFIKKPPAVPKKLHNNQHHQAENSENSCDEDQTQPPSSFMTKLSKFEYLASQNLKKTSVISPKVFTSNAVTVNTPAKDVLGKSPPPDLCNFTKNLPQSSLNNYIETHNNSKKINSKKSSQYVNVTLNNDTRSSSINNRVILYENGFKSQNFNIDESNEYYQSKPSSGYKNINMHRSVTTPSPGYNRNPGPYSRSITPSPISKNTNEIHRKSGSLDQLTNENYYDNSEQLNERKKEAEIKRNQAQQDRIKEEEQKRAEQMRLEEILNMCAEYEKQSQQNKPITPNRIKTNGSLPRDKRQSPYGPSPYNTPPPSPGVFDFQNRPNNYENAPVFSHRNKVISNYENIEISSGTQAPTSVVENQDEDSPRIYPNSPRTRIKTFLPHKEENNSIKMLEIERNLWENLNQKESEDSVQKVPETKFILPLEDQIEKSNLRSARYAQLKNEKRKLLDLIGSLKTLMSEIEIQEEELHIEMDMERALLSGEHKAKSLDLESLYAKKSNLSQQAQKIEALMADAQIRQSENEKNCKAKLKQAQENMEQIETELKNTEKNSENYEGVFERYLKCQEILDGEKKSFEDLEFHHLEEEANWLATREEVQRDLMEITRQTEHLKQILEELERQSLEAANANNKEYKSLESQKINCLVKLEEIRNRLKDIDEELSVEFSSEEHESSDSESSGNMVNYKGMSCSIIVSELPQSINDMNMSHSFNEKMMQDQKMLENGIDKRYPSQDDIDRISKVTSDSPIDIASLNRKTIESLREIEHNRKLHLCQQGSQVIEQERQRVQALKEKAQQEVRSKWAQRIQDRSSNTSTGSEGTVNGDKTDDSNNEKLEADTTNNITSNKTENNCRTSENDEENHRPLSEMSEMSLEGGGSGGSGTFKRRTKQIQQQINDKQRPLTRYLPIRGSDLDLRQHIESAGHQVVLCPHVLINSNSCRGFLHKKGSKLNGWSRRWFVFDRSKHTFSYYADKSEKKARGGAYFQAIEEVYLDHSKSVKSPNPQLTFIVKTHERYYYLMAPSPEAMRIWVDVIFTGAEGYREFEYGTT